MHPRSCLRFTVISRILMPNERSNSGDALPTWQVTKNAHRADVSAVVGRKEVILNSICLVMYV